MGKNKTIKKKIINKRKTVKLSAKEQENLRYATTKAINNTIAQKLGEEIDKKFDQNKLNEYVNVVSELIENDLISTNSYTPTINRSLKKLTNAKMTEIFKCEKEELMNTRVKEKHV